MKKYRSKKSSCALCKPHKMGWDDKHKPKDRAKMEAKKKEIKQHKDNHSV